MIRGVGGSSADSELSKLASSRDDAVAIGNDEYRARLSKARRLMQREGLDALYLDASSSLLYFTGLRCYPSERLHGAIVTANGELIYVCPAFEEQKTRAGIVVDGDFLLPLTFHVSRFTHISVLPKSFAGRVKRFVGLNGHKGMCKLPFPRLDDSERRT